MSTAPDVINLAEVVREREELEKLIRYLGEKLERIADRCSKSPFEAGQQALIALETLRKAGF